MVSILRALFVVLVLSVFSVRLIQYIKIILLSIFVLSHDENFGSFKSKFDSFYSSVSASRKTFKEGKAS